MCGLSGIFSYSSQSEPEKFISAVKKMSSLQVRRGPDDSGIWKDKTDRVFFGFQRLSIMDLSELGHQPMVSGDGVSSIVFNGEIYNFKDLRVLLKNKGIHFKSNSDTEVLLEGLNHYGIDFIHDLNGMFAFAWYSKKTGKLVLARDHAGIKPLYYFHNKEGIAFGSQFNTLQHTPWGSPGSVRQDVLNLYLHLHHIPAPYGLLENTFQLEPGELLETDYHGGYTLKKWWKLKERINVGLTESSFLEGLNSNIINAIEGQKFADVPLGVFMSGGIDSPLVSALTRKQINKPIKAFCIGNKGWGQDESQTAKEFAELLDLNFNLKNFDSNMVTGLVEEVKLAQHEPFADFSILPTLLVSKFAKSEVTVSLSGDGGDELFFGYERPFSLLRNGSDFKYPRILRMLMYGLGKYGPLPKKSSVIVHSSPGQYYFDVNSRIGEERLDLLAPDLNTLPDGFELYKCENYQSDRQLADFSRKAEYYGQMQRCLKKVDMASMHHSLEVRVPLLDKNLIEYSLSLDSLIQIKDGQRKKFLRNILTNYIPEEKLQSKKYGFSIPLGEWLKGPLKELAEDTLLSSNFFPEGHFDRNEIENYWKEHLTGKKDHKWGLWTLLSLQFWRETHMNSYN